MKGLLFDFWGTLVDNGIKPSPVRQAKEILKIEQPFQDYIVRFEEAFMTQDFEDLYAAFENVCQEFGKEPDKEVLDELVGMWNKSYLKAKPYPETIEVLESLQDDYKLGLISNTPSSIQRVLDKFDLEKYFDSLVMSYQTGMLKTNQEMFEIILNELGLSKDEVFMVGDSIATDIKGAERAGIKPILIDRWDNRHYERRISSLKELEKYLEGYNA